jgi:large subunit ribosomal protein L22
VRISGNKLSTIAQDKGVSVEQLAQSIERTGLAGSRSITAVNNWMRDNDHPRPKRPDIEAMAGALGVAVTDIAQFRSVLKHHRGSPRKAKLVVDLIRGKKVDTALNLLTFTTKRAAVDVKRALTAALAEAAEFEADEKKLYVVESTVHGGPHTKRFQPKDRGRAHPILVRSSHITIGLEERTGAGKSVRSRRSGKDTNN